MRGGAFGAGRGIATGAYLALAVVGCSGGAHSPVAYTRGYSPEGEGDDGDTEADTDDGGIDLDGGGPPPGEDPGPPPGQHHGDCCVGNGSPGCDNGPVEACVCASDPWCCDAEWDSACAALVESHGCGHCTDDGGGQPPPPGGGDCCVEHQGPGCDEPEVEACVCAIEPLCCSSQWSPACIAVLEVHGCGQCGAEPPPPPGGDTGGEPPPGGDTGEPPASGGDCCAGNGSPGCDDTAIESCVCTSDAYCCDNEWDDVCAGEVESLGCGSCGGEEGGSTGGTGGEDEPSECCAQQPGAGCAGDPAVQMCVCASDAYCCSVFWDLTCAGEVESLGCGSCG